MLLRLRFYCKNLCGAAVGDRQTARHNFFALSLVLYLALVVASEVKLPSSADEILGDALARSDNRLLSSRVLGGKTIDDGEFGQPLQYR